MHHSALRVSAFVLKVIAIVGMTACHVGVVFEAVLPRVLATVLIAAGGVTFPIMAFLLAEGYRHTSNLGSYAKRLAVFAVIAQLPYSILFEPLEVELAARVITLPFMGNVLFTLLLGLGLLYLYDKMHSRLVFWVIFVGATMASVVLDWGVLGPIMILMCHVLPDGYERRVYPVLLPMAALGIPALFAVVSGDASGWAELLYAFAGGLIAAMLLACYDGSRGRRLKWFFYVYYPAHLAVIALAAMAVGLSS